MHLQHWLVLQGKLPTGCVFHLLAGGRSNRVWHVEGEISAVLKLYHPASGNPMFANDPDREVSSLQCLAGTGMAPRLIAAGEFESARWILYTHVTGSTWRQQPDHVARLLGRLHDQPFPEKLPKGVNGSVQIETGTHHILTDCSGPEADRVARMRPLTTVPPTTRCGLIHGDPVPGNIVEHDGTLTLIDWQCPVFGDPAEDLAVFASPAMQYLYRGVPLSSDEEASFLSAYPDHRVTSRYKALKPWFHWRMAAYCLWKSQRGQQEYAHAQGLELAALLQAA